MTVDTVFTRRLVVGLLVVATFVPRLTSLGTMLTIDENLWRGRGELFIKSFASGHFDKTLVAGQPGVTTAWLVGLSLPWHSLASAQAAIAVACGVLILLTTYALTRLWRFWWGITGGFFIALDPFLIAHSRLVHTDALFALFYLASLVFLLVGLEDVWHGESPRRLHVVISAVLGSLALLTKIFTTILMPTVVLIFLVMAIRSRRRIPELFQAMIIWLAVLTLTTFALWPALWTAPEQVSQYLTGRATLHVSEGTHVGETTATWWYYSREGIFRLSAVTTLLLIPTIFATIKNRDRMWRTALILLLSGIAFAVILSFSSEKSDRYILISLLTLDLFAVLGLRQIGDWITSRTQVTAVGAPRQSHGSSSEARLVRVKLLAGPVGITGAAILLLAIGAVRIHPYYLAHHNALYPVEERHKLGWGEGLEQAAVWLEQNHPSAKVASYYPSIMKHWYGEADPLNHLDETTAPYVILYRSMFERGEGHVDTEIADEYLSNPDQQPIHTIFINNLPYVWIFERE